MPDHARSDHRGVQRQLDRLAALAPGADILGLERIARLLARLDHPERSLPPVFHVAGTNGKGSTAAFLRAGLEAAGHRVHVYSSPHLVRFNERIRIAGTLIDDDRLASLLAEVLDAGHDVGASFFEITTAAAFLAFARVPATASIIEVGLGGRLDATNVVAPLVSGIAALGVDHQAFLGNTPEAIAAEKAGIAKRDRPLVTMAYPASVAAVVAASARAIGAPLLVQNEAWSVARAAPGVRYRDAAGALDVPLPALSGDHQIANLGLAIAMLRHQSAIRVSDEALRRAATEARWPARLQRLRAGPLTDRLTAAQRDAGVWLDGAHNPSAARALVDAWSRPAPTIVLGMLANKDAGEVIESLSTIGGAAALVAVPVPGHDHHAPSDLAAQADAAGARWTATAPDLAAALDLIARRGDATPILIAGSLYLAGEVLRANDERPT